MDSLNGWWMMVNVGGPGCTSSAVISWVWAEHGTLKTDGKSIPSCPEDPTSRSWTIYMTCKKMLYGEKNNDVKPNYGSVFGGFLNVFICVFLHLGGFLYVFILHFGCFNPAVGSHFGPSCACAAAPWGWLWTTAFARPCWRLATAGEIQYDYWQSGENNHQ